MDNTGYIDYQLTDIPAYTSFEQYLTFPREYFKSTENAQLMIEQ
ncbi:MAG: hypothetical protein Q4Q22_03380 [Methanosphaera sp.]|nr:hypothetical protein [Methanosphaera sp.]